MNQKKINSVPFHDTNRVNMNGNISNNSEMTTQKKLEYQSEMQQILIKISSKFINLPIEAISQTVNDSMSKLGRFLKIDRIQIHRYNYEKNECLTEYEWCEENVPSTIDRVETYSMVSMLELLEAHQSGLAKAFEENTQMGEELRSFIEIKVSKKVLTVPMMLESHCVGFISFDSINHCRIYSDSEISMIKLFANMSVGITSRALDQKRMHRMLATTSMQNRRLKEFSQITSHNIRSSTANLIAINRILHDEPTNEEYLHFLDQTVDRLNVSVENLNQLLNFDSTNEIFEKKQYDLNKSLDEVIAENRNSMKKKGILVKNFLSGPLIVDAFPIFTDSIFQQLISNAIKYGSNKKEKVIEISSSITPSQITIIIKDYGRGIDLLKYGDKIFKAGVRLDAENGNGQGMGLFMVKYMLEAMGGKVSVMSQPGSGASFSVSFPALKKEMPTRKLTEVLQSG